MADTTERKKKYLPPEETSMFCEQVALILKSGIPLYDGVETLCGTYADTKYAATFKEIDDTVKATGSLGQAVENAKVFPPYMEQMVRIGENAGKLDDVMGSLGEYYNREAKVQASIKSAIVYPAVLLVMMTVVILVLVTQVLPIFERVFRNLGSSMDASMQAVMSMGTIIGYVMLGIIAALVLAGIVVFILYRMGRGDRMLEWVKRHFGPVRRIMEKTSAGRFASVVSIMMAAGFPISEAIGLTPAIVSDETTRKKLEEVSRQVSEEGRELPTAIADAEIFEPIYTRMIQMGYRAGQMDAVMARLSEVYEEDVDDSIRSLVGKVEPTLIAILAIVIGGILLAVMLPLASVMTSIL